MAGLAGRARTDAGAAAGDSGLRRGGPRVVRRVRAARDGGIEPRAGGAADREGREEFPGPRLDPSAGCPAPGGVGGSGPDAVRRRLQVGDDARNPLSPGLLLGARRWTRRPICRDHRPRVRARGSRAGPGLPCRVPRRADDRWALLGPVGVRDGSCRPDGDSRRATCSRLPRKRSPPRATPRARPSSSVSRSAPAGRKGATRSSSSAIPPGSDCGPSSSSPSPRARTGRASSPRRTTRVRARTVSR